MDAKDLREKLKKTENKLTVFTDKSTFDKYNINLREFSELVRDFLTDKEKIELLDSFEPGATIKKYIINVISNDDIKIEMLKNSKHIDDMNRFQMLDFIKNMSDNAKKIFLYDSSIIEKREISLNDIENIISRMDNQAKQEVLSDVELIRNKLHLKDNQISNLVYRLPDEKVKLNMIEKYEFEEREKAEIIQSFEDNTKMDIVLKDNDLSAYYKKSILSSLNTDSLSEFLKQNKDFFVQSNIHPYEITKILSDEKQREFVEKINDLNLSSIEKRKILITLDEDVKNEIDTNNLTEEQKNALSLKYKNGTIIVDLNRNLEDYRGLDTFLNVNPEDFTKEQKNRFFELCNICPNIQISNCLGHENDKKGQNTAWISSVNEYIEAEKWIDNLINSINPEYSDAQKIAVIDNAIGKKISYSPDYETEVENKQNARALWKIISSGYGVCNGIARVEQYILNKMGIESEVISGTIHAFLKLENIEFPLANGEITKGTTILDPTWNLTEQRFGAMPQFFCKSYEDIRKGDINKKGIDGKYHQNDEKLQDATFSLDEQSIRELYKSVGLADKDGYFPIKETMEKSSKIDEMYANTPKQNIENQFLLLKQVCPEFAQCQESTIGILKDVLLNNKNLKFNRCVINRVYDREDKDRKPVIFIYIDSDEMKRNFYYVDSKKGEFINIPQEEFTKQFECYDVDLKRNSGLRPWEMENQKEEEKDLSQSSGNIIAEGGADR